MRRPRASLEWLPPAIGAVAVVAVTVLAILFPPAPPDPCAERCVDEYLQPIPTGDGGIIVIPQCLRWERPKGCER